MVKVGLCWKGHVGLRPCRTSEILPDPFSHKGKIEVLIPRARRDKHRMLMMLLWTSELPRVWVLAEIGVKGSE